MAQTTNKGFMNITQQVHKIAIGQARAQARRYTSAPTRANSTPTSAPAPAPTPTPARAPTNPGFFTLAGQKQAFWRVGNVLNPFANNPIPLGNSNLDVGAPVRTIVRVAETALVAPGAIKAVGFLGTTTKAGIATASSLKPDLLVPAIAGIGGFALGGLLFQKPGATTAPQSATVTPTQPTQATQTVTPSVSSVDNSINTQNQIYTIKGSPGASIYGSQSQDKPITQTTIPNITQQPTQDTGLNQSQEANSSTDWATIALIGAGLYFLTK